MKSRSKGEGINRNTTSGDGTFRHRSFFTADLVGGEGVVEVGAAEGFVDANTSKGDGGSVTSRLCIVSIHLLTIVRKKYMRITCE